MSLDLFILTPLINLEDKELCNFPKIYMVHCSFIALSKLQLDVKVVKKAILDLISIHFHRKELFSWYVIS